jgi:hypothetical protein
VRKTLAVAAVAGLTIVSSIIATTGQADAHWRWGPAVGLGIAGGIIAGAVIANSAPAYQRCGWMPQYNRYGDYMGRTWVCNY